MGKIFETEKYQQLITSTGHTSVNVRFYILKFFTITTHAIFVSLHGMANTQHKGSDKTEELEPLVSCDHQTKDALFSV